MIGFGILIGIVFPFFVMVFGIEPEIALSPFFVLSCIMAGACVGMVNIVLTRTILVNRLKVITDKMILIKKNVMAVAQGISHEKCDFEVCQLKVNSNDEIGRNADAYNALVETLALTMSGEELISHLDHEAIVHLSLDQILEVTKSSAGCIFIERDGDVLLRYGGEEFLLVLPGASLHDTQIITEKIRRIVEESQVIYGDLRIKVTCSMGMTSIPEFAAFSEEELISKVDDALYLSKNNGRNQITQAKAF